MASRELSAAEWMIRGRCPVCKHAWDDHARRAEDAGLVMHPIDVVRCDAATASGEPCACPVRAECQGDGSAYVGEDGG